MLRRPLCITYRRCLATMHGPDKQVAGLKQKAKLSKKSSYFPVDYSVPYENKSSDHHHDPTISRYTRFIGNQKKRVVQFFLPNHYPESVNEDYWAVQKHWNIQWATSSALQVFATQSLLTSVGIGSGAALPLAATANWVLKDVLACFGVMITANKVGNFFDVYIKRSKWIGDILLNIGVGIEMIIQLFPSKFIILASISTLLKAISGMVNGSAKANVNRHFASAVRGKNLGDVTAKGQSQGVFAYVLGLFYGIGISYVCQMSGIPYLMVSNFVILNCIHLYCSYRSLSNLNIRFLNNQRGAIVTSSYLDEILTLTNGDIHKSITVDVDVLVPSPKQVAEKEVFVKRYKEKITVNMGAPIEQLASPTCKLEDIITHTKIVSDGAISYEPYLIHAHGDQVQISFHESATESDFIRAFFHSQVYVWLANNRKETTSCIWKDSHKVVQNLFPHYIKSLKNAGWGTNFILFFEPSDTTRFQFEITPTKNKPSS